LITNRNISFRFISQILRTIETLGVKDGMIDNGQKGPGEQSNLKLLLGLFNVNHAGVSFFPRFQPEDGFHRRGRAGVASEKFVKEGGWRKCRFFDSAVERFAQDDRLLWFQDDRLIWGFG